MDDPAEKLADDLDNLPEAEFLDVTGTKVFSVFPPCYSQSPL
jgi:hypothetical protein